MPTGLTARRPSPCWLQGLAVWCWYFGAGAVEPYVWMGGCAIGGSSVFISLFGYVLSVYHRRDERHAAKPMRPGGLLGLFAKAEQIAAALPELWEHDQ